MSLDVDITAHAGSFVLAAALRADPGQVLAVLGPNGAGKSTLLAAIAGHRRVDSGHVRVAGRDVDALPPERRRIGLLGQRAMLFPHLTALENVAFGPRAQGVVRARARDAAREQLEQVGLAELADRRPAELSGGQQQRVALARALAARPDALLLDEPFAALDAQNAVLARRLIAEQRDRIGIPIVLVTHDPMDAIVLAGRCAVLQDGRVVQQGTTADVLGHPASAFVADLVGVNRVEGVVDAQGAVRMPRGDVALLGQGRPAPGTAASAVFSPGSVRVSGPSDAAGPNRWTGTVELMEPARGGVRLVTAEQPGLAVVCPSTTAVALGIRPGAMLGFSVAEADVSVRASSGVTVAEREEVHDAGHSPA